MRYWEFASEEEQLSLLRLIVDSTWKALEQHALEQDQVESVRHTKSKSRPRATKRRKVRRPIARSAPLKPLKLMPRKAPKPAPKMLPIAPKAKTQPLQHKSTIKPIKAFSLSHSNIDGLKQNGAV